MLSLDLAPETERRLTALASKSGQSEHDMSREFLECAMDDLRTPRLRRAAWISASPRELTSQILVWRLLLVMRPDNEYPMFRLPKEDVVAVMRKLEIARAQMAGVPADAGECSKIFKRLVKLKQISLGPCETPFLQRIRDDMLDVGVGRFG